MPAHRVAVDWVNDSARSEEELRRACAIVELNTDGDLNILRARLNEALAKIAPHEEIVCLNPSPMVR
jgi:hypothetical protein